MNASSDLERQLRFAVGHQLDSPEQSAAPDVPHMRMIFEALVQRFLQLSAAGAHVLEQAALPDDALHGECRRTCKRMPDVGMAVLEHAGTVGKCVENPIADKRCAD